jgi:hypothetical protein
MAWDLQDSSIEQSDERWPRYLLTASFVISSVGLAVSFLGGLWASGQQVDYGDLSLRELFNGNSSTAPYFYYAEYLALSFLAGVAALILAFLGARAAAERPLRAILAGAMASALVMIPVVLIVSYEINHWYAGVHGGD